MGYTPLDVDRLRKTYRKHSAGPLLLFVIVVMVAVLAALIVVFLQKSS